ncbi:MAG: hypothetical protein V4508_04930 [Pseudomonadota bacterium]
MNITLGLRALALLAFVVASTTVIVRTDTIMGASAAQSHPFNPVAALSRA